MQLFEALAVPQLPAQLLALLVKPRSPVAAIESQYGSAVPSPSQSLVSVYIAPVWVQKPEGRAHAAGGEGGGGDGAGGGGEGGGGDGGLLQACPAVNDATATRPAAEDLHQHMSSEERYAK